MSRQRRIMTAYGTVQGVGFRPFVYRQAVALGLSGSVCNCPHGVEIDVEGEPAALDRLAHALHHAAPALARVERVEVREAAPRLPQHRHSPSAAFAILPSVLDGHRLAPLPADVAPCVDCLRELGDPADRRYRYPFINCTVCGPRLSIATALPYDRQRTSMAAFPPCPECQAEYADPHSRRFHAEPNACPRCGPTLEYIGPDMDPRRDALGRGVAALQAGLIVAVKGVGGFHLCCDAAHAEAVERLRLRKRRAARPFALLAADAETVARYAEVSDAERASLESPARPIVLLRRKTSPADGTLAPGVAPGLAELGFLLPPSPLHALLAADFAGPLVLTSGNLAEEPLARDNDEARARLGAIADAFLLHDRDIVTRLDDSLVRVEGGVERPLRRARGLVPASLPLSAAQPILAVGAELKSTLCLVAGGQAHVSQHLGDLGSPEARQAWQEARQAFEGLFAIRPAVVACDLHPDYASTRFAEELRLPLVRVQHHHAHAAACLAEHGHSGSAIAVVFDGAGHGEDGAVWGGELLRVEGPRAQRLGRLRYVRLPGGDAAAREPWRMALSYLLDADESPSRCQAPQPQLVRPLAQAIQRGIAAPWTSSAGRLFDAVAALCGLCPVGLYEGHAAMLLEAACADEDSLPPYPYGVTPGVAGGPLELDLRPMIRALVAELPERSVGEVAARFHSTLSQAVAEVAAALARREGISTVVLSGGCFQNRRLAAGCEQRLGRRGLRVLRPQRFPCNDGGVSLGQAAVAAWRMKE